MPRCFSRKLRLTKAVKTRCQTRASSAPAKVAAIGQITLPTAVGGAAGVASAGTTTAATDKAIAINLYKLAEQVNSTSFSAEKKDF